MANKKRLIDANVLIRDINADPYRTESEKSYDRCLVHRQPTVDAVEVVHGRWIAWKEVFPKSIFGNFGRKKKGFCSYCGALRKKENYCPYCGTNMDGDGNV